MAVNVLYTLASVPLALHYIGKAEFGLWALALQITAFIGLVDMGMGSSVARILIDHKDERNNGRYGGVIKGGFLVGAAQGTLVVALGFSTIWFLTNWLNLSAYLGELFFWLMLGQLLITAATFITRMFGQILFAWQRMDVCNYAAIAQLAAGFAALWASLHMGLGVFSLLTGSFVGWVFGTGINAWACRKLSFWPKSGEWGAFSQRQFRELFNYGADLFLISIGTQLVLSSPIVLISRQMGVEAAALWSVMTKMFSLGGLAIWKMISTAMPAFGEMHVRQESERLWARYRLLFIASNILAGGCAVVLAAYNNQFVSIWTQGKFAWPPLNNILLGIWLILLSQQCCFTSLAMLLKNIKTLKYFFLLEGIILILASLVLLPHFGITGLLVGANLATLFFTLLSGVRRIAKISELGSRKLIWDWQKPLIFILIGMATTWGILEILLPEDTKWNWMLLKLGLLLISGFWIAVSIALPRGMLQEIYQNILPLRRRK